MAICANRSCTTVDLNACVFNAQLFNKIRFCLSKKYLKCMLVLKAYLIEVSDVTLNKEHTENQVFSI